MLDLQFALAVALLVVPARVAGTVTGRWSDVDQDLVSDVAWWAGAGFVLAGRAAWLALNPQTLRYPIDVIRLTQGMITSAAVIGAVGALALLIRKRQVPVAAVVAPAGVMAVVAFLGWQIGCGLQDRCGGVAATWSPTGRFPVALVLGLVATSLVIWLARGVVAGRGGVVRPLAAFGVLLVAQFVVARWQLRLAAWPSANDLGLAVEGIAMIAVAFHRSRRDSATATALRPAG